MQKGFYWDEAILYAPRSRWEDAPASFFWNGPVYHIIPDLEKSLTELTKLPSPHTEQETSNVISHAARQ